MRWSLAAATLILMVGLAGVTLAQARAAATTPAAVLDGAAEALGGRPRVMGLRSLRLYGYGQNAQQEGGGNVSASPFAPQKWININSQVRTIDFEHDRMRLTHVLVQDFVFAYERNMVGDAKVDQALDGNVAYDVGADGRTQRIGLQALRARRIERLGNPVSILRAAYAPGARLGGLRVAGADRVLDLTTAKGDEVTIGFSIETRLPSWIRWTAPHPNYGDVTYTTHFVGYQPSDGLNLPSGYTTLSDFRGVVAQKIYVDKYELDRAQPLAPAPPNVVAAMVPSDTALPRVDAVPVAPHVWYLRSWQRPTQPSGSTLFEFADHLVLFEAYGTEANALATIAKAREVVPGKPLTHLIMSHHHIDHTGGLRAAVAEGLTVITNRGDNERFVREVTGRGAAKFPDALQRSGRVGKVRVLPVDDALVLKDSTLEVHIYRVTNNSHFADGLFAYVPAAKVVAEGDLFDETWDLVWWGNSYPDSVAARRIQVDRDLPVHGNINSYADVIRMLKRQTANAEALCARAAAARLTVRGCPINNTMGQY